VAELAAQLGMRHVVITSVTRDDLPDGGASQYAATAEAIQSLPRPPTCEALIPDFRGDPDAAQLVAAAPYRVLAHNVETVPRLYPAVRPQAEYRRSLAVLAALRVAELGKVVKSGLMLGLGESLDEVRRVLEDLRRAGVDALTLGQYLRPTPAELPVDRYVEPEEFSALAEEARGLGFRTVASAPYVRSSYRAAECL
jgi:lipoic acid synthetase